MHVTTSYKKKRNRMGQHTNTNKNERSPAQDRRLRFWNDIVYNFMAPVYNSLDWLTLGAWWRLGSRAHTPTLCQRRMVVVAAFSSWIRPRQVARRTCPKGRRSIISIGVFVVAPWD